MWVCVIDMRYIEGTVRNYGGLRLSCRNMFKIKL